ncbi:cobyrinate a,c-diamide synthase [[Phormidium] sp. ETS-05]|uniref:cobyrinate a,c-diamide synthase n=1 Tax=[Phormidium] sp. ETS-05 TaxID=222819 RepID=UPI0018EF0B9A|nr:cobyrinate a,c-diamide synthase [[Phormidium] sp. ETS-05]
MALTIAAERSSAGKTTVTLAILAYLSRRGATVQSFKVGPDYIDPMFHQYVTKRPCRNLDPVLTSPEYVKRCFATHCQSADYALVEGVMGLFDGVGGSRGALEQGSKGAREQGTGGRGDWGTGGLLDQGSRGPFGTRGLLDQGTRSHPVSGSPRLRVTPSPSHPVSGSPPPEVTPSFRLPFASTAWVAKTLEIPVLLVIDCSKLSGSVAAIAHGYRSLDPTITIAGVVLNRVGSDRHLELLQDALEPLNIPILGILRRDATITIGDRHLGLIPTGEIPDLDKTLDRLAQIGSESFDWERLEPLLHPGRFQKPGFLEKSRFITRNLSKNPVSLGLLREISAETQFLGLRIAVARDLAFNFYYQDNLDTLEELGAEIIYWSPINDPELPPNIHGMYFGGGFPEVFARQLSGNTTARAAVQSAIIAGIPTIAECGGLMYLCQSLIDFEGLSWPMVGVINANAVMGQRLTLGYRRATAIVDSPLLTAGTTVWGHEFHRSTVVSTSDSRITPTSPSPLFTACSLSPESEPFAEGWHQPGNLHAGYIHLHWGSRPEIPARFLQSCLSNLREVRG